jgi:hypothetical protein
MTYSEPLERLSFVTQQLITDFPPQWKHANKSAVYAISSPAGSIHKGEIGYSRWSATPLSTQVDILAAVDLVTVSPDYYDYVPVSADHLAAEWHVNFADPILFGYYGGGLFAQDEMQVAEHPALASLPAAIRSNGACPITKGATGPTPILVSGVERRAVISTNPNRIEERPYGLYGNNFASASSESIRRATKAITPPTISNIIAMAAPHGGHGRYSADQIEDILTIAFTGFTAAVSESTLIRGQGSKTIVHTGFWGCGAFGGNRVLMAILQLLAASMAGVDRVVFHAVDSAGTGDVNKSVELITDQLALTVDSSSEVIITNLVSIGFDWGFGDGN